MNESEITLLVFTAPLITGIICTTFLYIAELNHQYNILKLKLQYGEEPKDAKKEVKQNE